METLQNKSVNGKINDKTTKKNENTKQENPFNSISQERLFSILESLLLTSEKPLGLSFLKEIFKDTSVGTQEIKKALCELKFHYEDPSRGLSLEEIGGGWQFRTKTENREFIQKLFKSRPFRLSVPALEVLSIIAYKQPVIKSDVDEVRGVESGHLIRSLLEKKLVCLQGKSELPGKPLQYGTTSRFLEVFGLKNLKELPDLEEMKQLIHEKAETEDQKNQKEGELGDIEKISNWNKSDEQREKELAGIGETLKNIKINVDFEDKEKEPVAE